MMMMIMMSYSYIHIYMIYSYRQTKTFGQCHTMTFEKSQVLDFKKFPNARKQISNSMYLILP